MPAIHITKHHELVDLVCHRHYGRTCDVTEAVLAANPGLAALGPILPMGVVVTLPDIAERARRKHWGCPPWIS